MLLGLVLAAAVVVGAVVVRAAHPQATGATPVPRYPAFAAPTSASPTSTTTVTATTTVVSSAAGPTTASTAPAGAGKPCPDEAARYLPSGSGTALLDATTDQAVVRICRAADGHVFYDGRARGREASDDTHIFLPAQPSGAGFVAVNGAFTYTVSDGRLVVTQGSKTLSDDALTTVG